MFAALFLIFFFFKLNFRFFSILHLKYLLLYKQQQNLKKINFVIHSFTLKPKQNITLRHTKNGHYQLSNATKRNVKY